MSVRFWTLLAAAASTALATHPHVVGTDDDEPVPTFAFGSVLPDACRGALDSDAAIQRCLTTLNDGRPLAFNCSQLSRLKVIGAEPFATGTHKEAFRGVFEHVDVVVKRLRRHSLHGAAPPSKARDFVDEAMLMVLLKAPMHVPLLGHCFNDLATMNVVPYATPWREIVPDAKRLSFEARVDVALQLVDMLQWWLDSPFGSLVHCDIYDFQFALLADKAAQRHRVLLVDLDGLHPAPVSANRSCVVTVGNGGGCGRRCYKGEHYSPAMFGAIVPPLETTCVDGACVGLDSSFNVWTVCRVLFFDLFLLYQRPSAVPPAQLGAVHQLIDECAAALPHERPSLRRLRAKLEKIV